MLRLCLGSILKQGYYRQVRALEGLQRISEMKEPLDKLLSFNDTASSSEILQIQQVGFNFPLFALQLSCDAVRCMHECALVDYLQKYFPKEFKARDERVKNEKLASTFMPKPVLEFAQQTISSLHLNWKEKSQSLLATAFFQPKQRERFSRFFFRFSLTIRCSRHRRACR
jgi:hypothetical protein